MKKNTGIEFIEQTKYPNVPPSDQQIGRPPPPVVETINDNNDGIALPDPASLNLDFLDFHRLITDRASLRRYSGTPFSMVELSFLLWCTQGIKQVQGNLAVLRTVPSAGARHAFETILLINRVESLEKGVYKYAPLTHELLPFDMQKETPGQLVDACYKQKMVGKSAVTFFWIAHPYRMTWRYSERGYRYLYIDVGHVGQNLYLASEAIGGGACTIAAFDDDMLNHLFQLNTEKEFVIYLAAVGKK